MTEREIFVAALDLPDPAARAAYLERACAGDAGLRAKVDALLRSHDAAGSFLGNPAVEPVDPAHAGTRAYTPGADPNANTLDGEEPDDALTFLTPSARPDSLGRIGHYEVLQVLGKGGFGIVFRAFDDILQRVVAVKVMAPLLAATSPARKRFLREARSSAQVRHENVVQVYEVAEQPLPHLAMEFIPGETLQQRLDRVGPLDAAEIVRIGRQIAEGLAAAHACDLIHRDIKPGNVLIEGAQHRVKITDFGLARAADDASISQSGIIAGTPMYMAPEQALGNTLDQRADLFSLGSVLYQMAAGRPPFRAAGTVAVLKRVAEDTPRPIREIIPETPQWLCDIITKLHAKNPDDRYQSAREVADVLADCEAQLKANSKLKDYSRIPRGKAAAARSGRGKWVAAAAVLFAIILLAVPAVGVLTYLLTEVPPKSGPGVPGGNSTPAAPADGFVSLFNGKDLTGWKTHPVSGGDWRVENGAIDGRGTTSYLFHESAGFGNFHLRVEAKVNTTGDAGVYFRAPFDVQAHPNPGPAKFILPGGYEAAIAVRPNYPSQTGSLMATDGSTLCAGPLSPHRPDEWFVLEVIAEGNRIRTLVDGKPAADYRDEQRRFSRGLIALQTWGPNITRVQFRKIEIKELPAASAPPPAVAPFDAATAKAHQEAWAKHLGVPVEFENSVGMKFRLIPPGEFTMGSGEAELDEAFAIIDPADKHWQACVRSERPSHTVVLSRPIYIGVHEVTQAEYLRLVGSNPSHHSATGPGRDAVAGLDTGNHPVEMVNWNEAADFCNRLSVRANLRPQYPPADAEEPSAGRTGFRLPTEAEWEFACRAGTTTSFWYGDDRGEAEAWWTSTSGGRTHRVGELRANPFGLYDTHGNVWEWCQDRWAAGSYTTLARTPARDPEGVFTPDAPRVLRGGSFEYSSLLGRSAHRFAHVSSFRNPGLGFRLVIAGDLKVVVEATTRPKSAPPLTFTNGIGMEFVVVPKGKAWLGGGKDKLGDKEVAFPADFYLGKYEVTQEEWVKVMGSNPSHYSRTGVGTDAVKTITDADLKRFPVECVSWDDCQRFVEKLNAKEKDAGWIYRLPTTEEWEYACRGGPMADKADSAFDFYLARPTNTLLPGQANIDKGLNRTCKVGLFEANRLGLFDMHGNVFEWCGSIVTAPDGSSARAVRSSSYDDDARIYPSGHQSGSAPSYIHNSHGLRLARVPAGTPAPAAKAPQPPLVWTVLKPAEMKSDGGATLKLQADDSVLVSGEHPAKDSYALTVRDVPAKIHALRLEVLPHASLPKNGPGRHPDLTFVLSGIKAELEPPGKAGPAAALKLAKAWADHSAGDDSLPEFAIDGDDITGWSAEFDKPHFLVLELAEPLTVPAGAALRVTLEFKHENDQRQLGCFRLSASSTPQPAPATAP